MQTSYQLNPDNGIAGAIAYVGSPSDIMTMKNPSDEIVFGRLVEKVEGEDLTIQPLQTEGATQYGVSVLDETIAIDEDTAQANSYPEDSPVGVMMKGKIWGEIDQTVTSDDPVYARKCDTLNVSTLVMSGAGSGDFVASNSIAITVNGTAITGSPLAFTTDNATTLSALATLLQATDEIYTAVSDGSHTITITSSNADMPAVNLTITGGATQATDTQTQTVAGVAGDDQGVFRKDSDSGKATLVGNARFLVGGSSGDVALVELY